MKLTNSTKWRTDDLRALISAALQARGVPSTGLRVTVVVSKRHLSGYASLGKMREGLNGKHMQYGGRMTLRLPNPGTGGVHGTLIVDLMGESRLVTRPRHHLTDVAGAPDLRERFARVVEHEVAHLQGLDHKHMSERLFDCTQETPWLGELPLREQEEIAVDRTAAHADKEVHARAMLAKAETRLKRAETIAKRWRRRVGYYERQGAK